MGASLLFEHFHFRQAAGQLLLLAVAIDAWYGERGPALLSLILAILGMDYFFIPPLYSFRVAPEDLPYFTTFISLAVLVCWFSTVRRRVEADLRQTRDKLKVEVEERSSLLDLTNDSISVRNMDFILTYWNRGAEEFYGWSRKEAVGKRSEELLCTIFPKSVEEIRAELLEKDQWEGELTRTKANGTQVMVSSRWSLRRDQ